MFLTEIIELKKARLAATKAVTDFDAMRAAAYENRRRAEKHRLRARLAAGGVNVIAEIKRASPSKGVINDAIDVGEVARGYEAGGACAISVLTEEDRFRGSLADLETARAAVSLPLLRKDFMLDEFQFFEAAAAGADVILLIAAMLDDAQLKDFLALSEQELGLDALVEVHTLEELERVTRSNARIIGVNNRDLHSFRVTLDVSRELIKHAPEHALMITESGLSTPEEIRELAALGYRGFLIGETLMRSGNAEEGLKSLIG